MRKMRHLFYLLFVEIFHIYLLQVFTKEYYLPIVLLATTSLLATLIMFHHGHCASIIKANNGITT